MVKKCITDFHSKDSRKVFEGILQYQINLYDRYYSDDIFSLLVVQIENLKKHSNDVQDIIRQEVGNFLVQNSRNSDVTSPISADKFAILSPKTNIDEALGFAKKIKEYTNGKRFELSISIGEYEKETKEEFILRINDSLLHSDTADKHRCYLV